jgi:hypothetical protein
VEAAAKTTKGRNHGSHGGFKETEVKVETKTKGKNIIVTTCESKCANLFLRVW